VDVVVAPTNVYLEMPQPYKASVSAALRRAAARRGLDGAIVADEVADELRAWVSQHGRPGMPVAAGSVAVTSAGALGEQGIRRIYHAAVATPRPGTNDYDVMPTAITQAVHATFAMARSERDRFTPPLGSLGFPLLGAGRGGLDPATSFAWIWAALEREVPRDNTWAIHFITHQRATAEVIAAGISQSGGIAADDDDGRPALAQVRFHTVSEGPGLAAWLVTDRAKSGRPLASRRHSQGPGAGRRSWR
jgi:O-acetyl-ADP-ribose deacetylase (regulator of RNase III)